MRPRTGFILRALGFSVLLFGSWWAIITGPGHPWILEDAGFGIPVLAIILAARLDRRKKVWVIGTFVVLFVLGDVLAELLGVRTVAETGVPLSDTTMGHIGAALYHAFRIGLPIGTLLAASRGDLRILWHTGAAESVAHTCPVCGRRKAGLEAHIRDAHGEKALKKAQLRGHV